MNGSSTEYKIIMWINSVPLDKNHGWRPAPPQSQRPPLTYLRKMPKHSPHGERQQQEPPWSPSSPVPSGAGASLPFGCSSIASSEAILPAPTLLPHASRTCCFFSRSASFSQSSGICPDLRAELLCWRQVLLSLQCHRKHTAFTSWFEDERFGGRFELLKHWKQILTDVTPIQ